METHMPHDVRYSLLKSWASYERYAMLTAVEDPMRDFEIK